MRVVIFWTMCHHSLGHEKKALLIALCLADCFTAPQFGAIPRRLISISFSLFKILQPGLSWDSANMTISLQV